MMMQVSTAQGRHACRPLRVQQHNRRRTEVRFQPASQQSAAAPSSVQPVQKVSTADNMPAHIPAPQEMQASVMLVPKETAISRLQASSADSPLNSFLVKCRLAWNLFFPPNESAGATRQLSPKELGKQRLSMILVADRCGLSPNSLVEMKRSTLAALQDCMDLEDLQDAHLRFTMTRENGVTYSMAVPILRTEAQTEEAGEATATASWDEADDDGVEEEDDLHAGLASPVGEGLFEADEGPVRPRSAFGMRPGTSQDGPRSAETTNPSAAGDAQFAAAAPSSSPMPGAAAAVMTPPGSRAGSRGASPAIEIPLEGTAAMTPDMLKELLVEELVHDVEELVAAADGSAEAEAAADVLTEQLEAALAEVQHFGERPPSSQAAAGTGEHPDSEQLH